MIDVLLAQAETMDLFSPPPVPVIAIPSTWTGLPPLRHSWPSPHWTGDDGLCCFIEVQGSFAAVAIRKGPMKVPPAKRGEVKHFSPASRLRMFKLMNRLDMENMGRCTFATMTWRDELLMPWPGQITSARSNFHKSIERLAGRHIAGVWRVEWVSRKSGRRKGWPMPHLHEIWFDCPYLPVRQVAACWASAIAWDGQVSVKLEELVNKRKALYYVSKYVAKTACPCNLDIASYLGKHMVGRKWGCYRKELLPVCDKFETRIVPGALVDRLRAVATASYAKTEQNSEKGFTVFGDAARAIEEIVQEYLDKQPPVPLD